MKRHLTKLPEKSFKVAPGDVVGGLIYVMDKPLGIEEGMVGMSIDAPAYREYIKSMLINLDGLRQENKKSSNPDIDKLLQRYSKMAKFPSFKGLNADQQNFIIDLMMYDPKIPQYLTELKKAAASKDYEAVEKLKMAEELLNNINIDNLPKNGILKFGKDNPYKKHRHGPSWSEAKKVLFSTGKLHEVKAGQAYYVNEGMGGLLFDAYQKKCNVKASDHFATKIKKLIQGGKNQPKPDETNKIYMVKQDGEMVLGGTGPGWNKMMKTTTGKSFQFLANPFLIAATAGLSGLVYGGIMLGWRAFYLRKNKPTSANSDAIVESLATKLAEIRGMTAQEIDTINGTYANGAPKIATVVTWTPGCRDLSGRLTGGESELASVAVLQTDKGELYKVDAQGNMLKEIKKDDEVIGYEKMDKDGNITPNITKEEFDAASAISDDRIAGFGESLIGMISAGDHDGIGKKGQNKAIIPLIPPQDPQVYQFYGIDYGKAYQRDNPIIGSLKDDFSFTQPSDKRKKFSNYSMLYDNPLSEKMKGVYLLAALRGKLSNAQKEKIAADFEARGDKSFALKLLGYPPSLKVDELLPFINEQKQKYQSLADKAENSTERQKHLQQVQELGELYTNIEQTKDKSLATTLFSYPASVGKYNSDLLLIKAEQDKYERLAKEAEQGGNLEKRDEYLSYATRVAVVERIARETDDKILSVFESRIQLTPSQLDLLDNLEKLTSKKVTTLSPDGKVQLNHIRVEPEGRFAWQFEKDGSLISDKVPDDATAKEIREKLSNLIKQLETQPKDQQSAALIDTLIRIQSSVKKGEPIKILNTGDPSIVTMLEQHMTESTVAKSRPEIKTFRSPEQRSDFHKMVRHYEQIKNPQTKDKEAKEKKAQENAPPSMEKGIDDPEINKPELNEGIRQRVRSNTAPSQLPSASRKKVVTPIFALQKREEHSSSPQQTLGQTGIELNKLRKYITDYAAQESNRKIDPTDAPSEKGIHRLKVPSEGIKTTRIGDFKQHEALELTFKQSKESKVKAYAQASPDQQGIVYSTPAGLEKDPEKFKFAAEQICLLAVMNASPGTEFDLTIAPKEQQGVLKQAFDDAIKVAIEKKVFTEENRPYTKGEIRPTLKSTATSTSP
ncbi:MAG: hypothetical protein BGO43_13360 [Gammaproteobacteria bacterium 39-13]|nr:hypothetical protein [Gammaproteobacteria bacterium]OJV85715.1 MAG: hypothetical protein BGO43_13360 [Gammaproteobacteria bacterium 39-13]